MLYHKRIQEIVTSVAREGVKDGARPSLLTLPPQEELLVAQNRWPDNMIQEEPALSSAISTD